MKLFTLNQLCCPKCASFPLSITELKDKELSPNPMPVNISLLKNIYHSLNFAALQEAAASVGIGGLPDQFPEELPIENDNPESNPFVQALSTLLFNVDLVNCTLQCKDCERKFLVDNKIPNLVLNEEEVEEKAKLLKARGTKKFILHEMTNQSVQE